MIVCDTGPIVAAALDNDDHHHLAAGDFQPTDLTTADYRRMTELVRRYADLPLGTTDASVIALTERLGLTEVAPPRPATLQHRQARTYARTHATSIMGQ